MHYAFKSLTLIKIILIKCSSIQTTYLELEYRISILYSNSMFHPKSTFCSIPILQELELGLQFFSQIPIMQTEQTHII